MGYILSLLTKLDAAIQKRFDAICFFLMRRFGVRKSMIRYALAAMAAVSIALALTSLGRYYEMYAVFGFCSVAALATIFAEQSNAMHKDLEAERSTNVRSEADVGSHAVTKFCWTIGIALSCVILAHRPPLALLGFAHFFMFGLALEYLKKTPMNPPAEKAREHVGTPQVAPAKS